MSSCNKADERRIVAISDCENGTACVKQSLRFAGLMSKNGQLTSGARHASIVQTGDLLHKRAPDPSAIEFWDEIRTTGAKRGCAVHILAGNHEMEIWQRLQSGQDLGLKRQQQKAVKTFIRTTRLFHVEGSILFIHGYPTVGLLRDMRRYQQRTGKSLNRYNKDRFQPALDCSKQLIHYSYPRGNALRGILLHDVPDPEHYYRRHGKEVAALLGSLDIDLVIHGHRPKRSGIQTDYELRRWLPGVRMINTDIQLRLRGLGATVIRQVDDGRTDVLFVNRRNSSPSHRKDVRRYSVRSAA